MKFKVSMNFGGDIIQRTIKNERTKGEKIDQWIKN